MTDQTPTTPATPTTPPFALCTCQHVRSSHYHLAQCTVPGCQCRAFTERPKPYRLHVCANGHSWRAPVDFGETSRLSGERTAYCPTCKREATQSAPWTLADGTPYPFDLLNNSPEWRERKARKDAAAALDSPALCYDAAFQFLKNHKTECCRDLSDYAWTRISRTMDYLTARTAETLRPTQAEKTSPACSDGLHIAGSQYTYCTLPQNHIGTHSDGRRSWN